MEVWNGWAFLTSTGLMGLLGLLIFWLPVLVGETEGPQQIQTGEVNTGGILEVFASCGIFSSVSLWFTAVGYRETHAPLRAASVTIFSDAIV